MTVTWLKIAVLVIVMIVVGFFIRYGSGHPCDWLVHDLSAKSGMPQLVIEGVLLAQFRGEDPTVGTCLSRWVDLHVNGVEPQFIDQ